MLPDRLAGTDYGHAETWQRGQIQQMRQCGDEGVIRRMDSSNTGLRKGKAAQAGRDGRGCGGVQEAASIHWAPWMDLGLQ
jgi:hypothetical protein